MSEPEQMSLYGENAEYDAFVEKFKPKKTTDDCYTPPEIMECVQDYVAKRYGIDKANMVRPFWPGADYQAFDYTPDTVVVDNPPFSILSKIIEYYLDHGMRFFLFAPSLTALSGRKCVMRCNHIICDCDITYENGAVVRTAFCTNLDDGVVLEVDPEFGNRLNAINRARLKAAKRKVGKYIYPDHVITAARAQWYAAHNTPFRVMSKDCEPIYKLDAMGGKCIFGGGLLLSDQAAADQAAAERAAAERAAAERAAAERAAAERAAAERWQLSEREIERVRRLSGG